MDTQTVALIAFAILAVVVLAAMLIYRRRIKVGLKGLGSELTLEGEDRDRQGAPAPTPAAGSGIRMEGVKSRAGGVHAEDRPGHGISMKDVDARGDVRAVSGDSDPKAKPPA